MFRIQGENINIHFPEEKSNYFQEKQDNATFEENPHLLSEKIAYIYKNFTALNLSTEFQPISTENLNNDEANKILKLKYELEKENYEDESNTFWEAKKQKIYNLMMSDFQKTINKKKNYPETEITGIEFGKYDPILDKKPIKTIFKK